MLLLGNDTVDLNYAGIAGKSRDTRFVKRVFSDKEQFAISASTDPDLTLWIVWAAKEAAYKIISKIIGPPVFSHRKFEATFLKSLPESQSKIEVVYNKWIFPIEITFTRNYIHAVGAHIKTGALSNYLRSEKVHRITKYELKTWESRIKWLDNFTKEELLSIRQAESALVRFYCKKSIAEKLKITPSRLQIIRPSKERKSQPPFILLDNKRTEIDISLSHHGSWLGWCFSMKL